jgi:hypothetical protein
MTHKLTFETVEKCFEYLFPADGVNRIYSTYVGDTEWIETLSDEARTFFCLLIQESELTEPTETTK